MQARMQPRAWRMQRLAARRVPSSRSGALLGIVFGVPLRGDQRRELLRGHLHQSYQQAHDGANREHSKHMTGPVVNAAST